MGMSDSSQFSTVVIILLLSLGAQHSNNSQGHELHLNYVKPYKKKQKNTCPSDPCLTLEEYRNVANEYFLSDSEFTFIPGDYIFYGWLRLTNVTNMYFHANGGEKHKVCIFFNFPSNLTFTASNNIIHSVTLHSSLMDHKHQILLMLHMLHWYFKALLMFSCPI